MDERDKNPETQNYQPISLAQSLNPGPDSVVTTDIGGQTTSPTVQTGAVLNGPTPLPKPSKPKKIVTIITLVLVLLIVLAVALYVHEHNKKSKVSNNSTVSQSSKVASTTTQAILAKLGLTLRTTTVAAAKTATQSPDITAAAGHYVNFNPAVASSSGPYQFYLNYDGMVGNIKFTAYSNSAISQNGLHYAYITIDGNTASVYVDGKDVYSYTLSSLDVSSYEASTGGVDTLSVSNNGQDWAFVKNNTGTYTAGGTTDYDVISSEIIKNGQAIYSSPSSSSIASISFSSDLSNYIASEAINGSSPTNSTYSIISNGSIIDSNINIDHTAGTLIPVLPITAISENGVHTLYSISANQVSEDDKALTIPIGISLDSTSSLFGGVADNGGYALISGNQLDFNGKVSTIPWGSLVATDLQISSVASKTHYVISGVASGNTVLSPIVVDGRVVSLKPKSTYGVSLYGNDIYFYY